MTVHVDTLHAHTTANYHFTTQQMPGSADTQTQRLVMMQIFIH